MLHKRSIVNVPLRLAIIVISSIVIIGVAISPDLIQGCAIELDREMTSHVPRISHANWSTVRLCRSSERFRQLAANLVDFFILNIQFCCELK